MLSALSSRNIGLRGTSRFCVNPSLLRAFSAACLLRCVRSLLRAFSLRDSDSAACPLPTLLRASSIPHSTSKAILSYPIHNSLSIRTVALENQAPTHPIRFEARVSLGELSPEVGISPDEWLDTSEERMQELEESEDPGEGAVDMEGDEGDEP